MLLISKENPSVETLKAYKQFQFIRASKKIYYSEKIDSSKHDPKSLWKTISRKQSKNSSIDNNIGNINNLVPKTSVLPESFLKNYPDINFEFGLLSNINWDSLYCLTVADVPFKSFWDSFITVFELHFPLITKKFNKNILKL